MIIWTLWLCEPWTFPCYYMPHFPTSKLQKMNQLPPQKALPCASDPMPDPPIPPEILPDWLHPPDNMIHNIWLCAIYDTLRGYVSILSTVFWRTGRHSTSTHTHPLYSHQFPILSSIRHNVHIIIHCYLLAFWIGITWTMNWENRSKTGESGKQLLTTNYYNLITRTILSNASQAPKKKHKYDCKIT